MHHAIFFLTTAFLLAPAMNLIRAKFMQPSPFYMITTSERLHLLELLMKVALFWLVGPK